MKDGMLSDLGKVGSMELVIMLDIRAKIGQNFLIEMNTGFDVFFNPSFHKPIIYLESSPILFENGSSISATTNNPLRLANCPHNASFSE